MAQAAEAKSREAMEDLKQAQGTDLVTQLQKLSELRDAGVLSEHEFQAAKAGILKKLS
jgi:hypothetical protein